METLKAFWCNKVLPLIYDNSLSYYETVEKVVAKLNEVVNWLNSAVDSINASVALANAAAERAEAAAERAEHALQGEVLSVNGMTGDVVLDIPTKVSDLVNDSGFVNASQAYNAAPVQSVNNETGDVVLLIPTKFSDLDNDSGFVDAAGAADAAPVQSVNTETGDVVLSIPTQVSDLDNDSGFVDASGAAAAAPVQSVNTETGDVVLSIPTKVSDLNNDSGFVNAAGAAAAAPVQSVNGDTGAVDVWESMYLGNNPIDNTSDDTLENWAALGSGWAWYNTSAMLLGQPNQWGMLFNFVHPDSDVFQIWKSMSSGALYYRSGNQYTTWNASSWIELADISDIPT